LSAAQRLIPAATRHEKTDAHWIVPAYRSAKKLCFDVDIKTGCALYTRLGALSAIGAMTRLRSSSLEQ